MILGNSTTKISTEGIETDVLKYLHNTVTYELDCKKEIPIPIAKAIASLKTHEKLRMSKYRPICVTNKHMYSCRPMPCVFWKKNNGI